MDNKDKRIARLEELLAKSEKLLTNALKRISELERKLGLNSENSSKPPSSDGLRKKPTPKSLRIVGGKPSGGQMGHKGHTLEHTEHPTFIIRYTVDACERCGETLPKQEHVRLIKRQIFDIPEPKIEVTEHQAEVKICACGHHTTACFPETIKSHVQYGSRTKALAVYLSNQQMIPEDRLQETFQDLFGLCVSTATLATINRNFSQKMNLKQEAILMQLKASSIKHLDETSLRIGSKTQWLHVISNEQATHYRVSQKRGDLLEGLQGTVVHDHWKPYFTLDQVQHALCNAHHLRELKALEEIEKEPWAFKMSQLLRITCRLKDPPLQRVMALYDKIVASGLAFHEKQNPFGGRKKRVGHNLLLRLHNFKDATLRFLTTPGVPFTNNQAEQDIRMMKVKQKISGCFRTLQGAEDFCVIRGFLSTQRKQSFNLFQSIQLALP